MIINDVPILADCLTILYKLRADLVEMRIPLLSSIKDTPDNVMVSCIYHKNGQERRPSAGIKKDTGVYHCFTCGEVHDLTEVISHCFGDDDNGVYGCQWILKNFATVDIEEREEIKLDFERNTRKSKNNSNADISSDSLYVSAEELDSYRYYHPYMYKRGLTDDIIDIFDIGFDASTNCITFPIRDVFGNCLFVARRSVHTKYFNYPSGAVKPLYGLYELINKAPKTDEVVLCESMLDCLSCWVYGKPALALNGLGNELQFKQLRELDVRKIILATDMDDRGLEARTRIRRNSGSSKIVTEYLWPDLYKQGVKDINDMTREQFRTLEEVF